MRKKVEKLQNFSSLFKTNEVLSTPVTPFRAHIVYFAIGLTHWKKSSLSQTNSWLRVANRICCQLNIIFNWMNTVPLFSSCEINYSITYSVQTIIYVVDWIEWLPVAANFVDSINFFLSAVFWIAQYEFRVEILKFGKWQTQYGEPKCKNLLDLDENGFFRVVCGFLVKIGTFKIPNTFPYRKNYWETLK